MRSPSALGGFANTAATSVWARNAGVERKWASVELKLAPRAYSSMVLGEEDRQSSGYCNGPNMLFYAAQGSREVALNKYPLQRGTASTDGANTRIGPKENVVCFPWLRVRVLRGRSDYPLEKPLVSDNIERRMNATDSQERCT